MVENQSKEGNGYLLTLKKELVLADPGTLAKVLTYHVVSDRLLAADVVMQTSLTSVEGSTLFISTIVGAKINDSKIIMTGIICKVVVHVVDAVLIRP